MGAKERRSPFLVRVFLLSTVFVTAVSFWTHRNAIVTEPPPSTHTPQWVQPTPPPTGAPPSISTPAPVVEPSSQQWRCASVAGNNVVAGFEGSAPKDAFAAARKVLVVVGIPSVDLPFGLERRNLQRRSWMTYPGVWRGRPSDPLPRREDRAMLVRYVLARHPNTAYEFSAALQREQTEESDIIAFDLKEGTPDTSKKAGGSGHWGLESEVGMSRKAYAWYCWAVRIYTQATYIMKADDDLFLRGQRLLRDLSRMPRRELYWGPVMMWGARKNDPTSNFPYVGGMTIVMSRDLVVWIATSDRGAVNQGLFHGDKDLYKTTNHDHEDVMVGRMFHDSRVNVTVFRDCRFHDVHSGANKRPVSALSVGIHHVRVEEYAAFRLRFVDADEIDATNGTPELENALRQTPNRLRHAALHKIC